MTRRGRCGLAAASYGVVPSVQCACFRVIKEPREGFYSGLEEPLTSSRHGIAHSLPRLQQGALRSV